MVVETSRRDILKGQILGQVGTIMMRLELNRDRERDSIWVTEDMSMEGGGRT